MVKNLASALVALIVAFATIVCLGSPVLASPCPMAMERSGEQPRSDCDHGGVSGAPCTAQCLLVAPALGAIPSPRPAPAFDAEPIPARTPLGFSPSPSTPPPRALSV